MVIQPTQPQSIGAVLDTSFQLYKASLPRVWPTCLLFVLAAVPQAIYFFTTTPGTPNPPFDPTGMLDMISRPGYWGVNLLAGFISLWALGALYFQAEAIGADREQSMATALQRSLGRLVPLFLMGILFGLAVACGFILFLVPGFILMVSLMLGWNLLLLESKGPVASLTGSHRLVWGNWWRTAVILTVGFIIFMITYMALALVIGIATPLLSSREDALMNTYLSSVIISAILYVVAMPYYVALLMAVYWDLKLRKEGGDLAARVGTLNAA
jgi:hypothetical protein